MRPKVVPVYSEHARDRAWERYSLALTTDELKDIHAACIDGRAPCVERDRAGLIYVCTVRGVTMYPLLATDSNRLVTFIPPEHFTPGGHRKWRLGYRKNRNKSKGFGCPKEYKRAAFKRAPLEAE